MSLALGVLLVQTMDVEEFELDSVVCGHRVYKSPVMGELLVAEVEDDNDEDQYAVAVLKGGHAVGHVHQGLSSCS